MILPVNDQVTSRETAEILRQAELALGVEGDFVELGCYKGYTSVLLGQLLQKHPEPQLPQSAESASSQPMVVGVRKLWIYDSFAGLPDKTAPDASGAGANFKGGELFVTKREVVDRIKKHGLKNVIVKKAWFDQLEAKDLPSQIAFAFCDGDLYASIKTSLQLVLPRLSQGGIIVVHDYNNSELPGSARAVDEFLRQHPDFKIQVRHRLAILTQQRLSGPS